VRERIRKGREVVRSSLLKVFGPTEAQIKELLQGIGGGVELVYLSSFPEIHLKLVGRGAEERAVEVRLKRSEAEIADRLGIDLFNQAKEALLGVPHAILERYGPVSRETAEQMAIGVREASGATIGIATTGIAGPAGGTPENPVGRVFVALVTEARHEVKQYDFSGHRHGIKLIASELALDRVRRYLLGM
jgi:PncC family amidohydrolase